MATNARNTEIEPVTVIPAKRLKQSINCNLCILCQVNSAKKLYDGTPKGCDTIKEAYDTRVANGDASDSLSFIASCI